jgi:hypothetical protein
VGVDYEKMRCCCLGRRIFDRLQLSATVGNRNGRKRTRPPDLVARASAIAAAMKRVCYGSLLGFAPRTDFGVATHHSCGHVLGAAIAPSHAFVSSISCTTRMERPSPWYLTPSLNACSAELSLTANSAWKWSTEVTVRQHDNLPRP